jgi:hypothetical protein
MNKFVQAIIINKSSILCKTKNNENDQVINIPISTELLEGETPNQGLEKLIREQFSTNYDIVFKLSKETYSNTTTFLVNINNIDILNEKIEGKNFRWVSFNDKNSFTFNEKLLLSNLLLACIDNNYSADWIEPIRDMVSSDSRLSYSNSTIISKIRSREHKNMDNNTHMKEKAFAVLVAIFLGFIYNTFFFSKAYGASYPIFTALIILIFFYNFRRNIKKAKPIGIFILGIAFILSLNFAVHSNRILNFLNVIAVPMLLTASFLLIRYEGIEWGSIKFVVTVFERIIPSTFENIFKPILFAKGNIEKRERGKLNPQTKSILIGLLVSVPILIVILPLLSSADSVFGYYTSNFYTSFRNINIGSTLWDIIKIAVVALYLFGFFWSFRYSYTKDTKPSKVNGKLEPITVLTVLVIINLVYLLFSIVQFSYLYGGGTVLPNGFTYAEYARRGFFELVLVTIINFTILILATMYTKKENPLKAVLNGAYTLLIVFTFNMLYSAHYKMSLYENTFGYTYLRIFVHLFLILLFILFLIVLIGIWFSKIPVARLSIIAAFLMYVFINFVNVDSIIVKKNIERYYDTGKIDVHYLYVLSYDAVPHVLKFAEDSSIDDSIRKKLLDYSNLKRDALSKDWKWFEFNYSMYKAEDALVKNMNPSK